MLSAQAAPDDCTTQTIRYNVMPSSISMGKMSTSLPNCWIECCAKVYEGRTFPLFSERPSPLKNPKSRSFVRSSGCFFSSWPIVRQTWIDGFPLKRGLTPYHQDYQTLFFFIPPFDPGEPIICMADDDRRLKTTSSSITVILGYNFFFFFSFNIFFFFFARENLKRIKYFTLFFLIYDICMYGTIDRTEKSISRS